jgi:hypothetical protein
MDYGFTHEGKVYTPNGTIGVSPAENADRNQQLTRVELARWAEQPDRQLAYFHFPHEGKHVYTPQIGRLYLPDDCVHCDKPKADHGALEPDRARPYRSAFYPRRTDATVTTWTGEVLGAITSARVYPHNFGGRFVAITVKGTNGAIYHGRASYDNASCIWLRKAR